MATKRQKLEQALKDAIQDGASEDVKKNIAAKIAVLGNETPASELGGALEQFERQGEAHQPPDSITEGGIKSFGGPEDFAKGMGRTAKFLLGLPGAAQAAFGNAGAPPTDIVPGQYQQPQQATHDFQGREIDPGLQPGQLPREEDISQLLLKAGVTNQDMAGGQDTLMGRGGEFASGGLIGGGRNIAKATAQSGLRGAGGSTARNLGASEVAMLGSEAGGNYAAQLGLPRIAGNITGALVPSSLIKMLNRGATGASQAQRAKNSLVAKENVTLADDIGVPISFDVASPNHRTKFLGGLLRSVPGGMRVMHEQAAKVVSALEIQLARITQPLRGGAGREAAGAGISTAMNRHIEGFQRQARTLYRVAESSVAPNHRVTLNAFTTRVRELADEHPDRIDDLVNVLRAGRKPLSPEVTSALDKLTGGMKNATARLSFEEATALRRVIGAEINSTSSITNAAHGELKQMYGSLVDDIGSSMTTPRQKALWKAADNHWKKGREEIDNVFDKVWGKAGKDTPRTGNFLDKVFGTQGADINKLQTVWKTMNATERDIASKAFIVRMGRVSDEAMGAAAAGSTTLHNPSFRLKSFITKWNDPQFSSAKELMFKSQPQFKKDMDQFVSYMDEFLATNGAMANPSQSGPVGLAAATFFIASAGVAGGAAGMAMGDDSEALKATAMGAAGMLLAAKSMRWSAQMMTNPRTVNWLARGTRIPINKTQEHIGQLLAIAKDDPAIGEAIADFMNEVTMISDPMLLGPSYNIPGINAPGADQPIPQPEGPSPLDSPLFMDR